MRREIGTLIRLRHPYIATFMGVISEGSVCDRGDPYADVLLVSEACFGGSVYDRIFGLKDMTRDVACVRPAPRNLLHFDIAEGGRITLVQYTSNSRTYLMVE